jgi:hypothetical protein
VLTVRPYGPADERTWDAFVRASRTPHFLFVRGYMEYHADRFVDASLLVHDDDRLVGVLPASSHDGEVISHGGLTFGGLVTGPRGSLSDTMGSLDAICAHLHSEGMDRLVYKPLPHIYHRSPAQEDLYALFRSGATLTRRDISSAVLLDNPLSYAKGRRHAVKRGGASGLDVGRDEDFDGFVAVLAQTLERHGVQPVHSGAELALLASRFPDGITLWTARHEGQIVAGVVMYVTEVVAHTQYIAATDAGRELGAVDVLVDSLMQSKYADRRWFDFGISTEQDGRYLNIGLARNKESWGARAVAYDWYALEL